MYAINDIKTQYPAYKGKKAMPEIIIYAAAAAILTKTSYAWTVLDRDLLV